MLNILNPPVQLGQRPALVGKIMQTRHHRRGVRFGLVVAGGVRGRRRRLLFDHRLQDLVFPIERRGLVRRLLPGVLQLRLPGPECPPGRQLSAQRRGVDGGGTRHRYRLLLGRGMLLRRLLQFAPLVAALPCEVEPRVFQLVLIECELRLGQLELGRRLIAGWRVLFQFRDSLAARRNPRVDLRYLIRKLAHGTGGGRFEIGRFADCRGECLVQLVVGQTGGLARQVHLLRRLRQRCQLASGHQQPAVHQRRLGYGSNGRRVARQPCRHQACRQQQCHRPRQDFPRSLHVNESLR